MSDLNTSEQIVQVADELFYQNGYAQTSFADIAKAVQISRGNFYYHFKTKDQILKAVIDLRLCRTRQMLGEWEQDLPDPKHRIGQFIEILIMNRAKITRYGCPVGTLSTELSKLEHAAQDDANLLFDLFRDWLERQFCAAGRPEDAPELAMRLLARSQGIATLSQAYQDEAFVDREVHHLNTWLNNLLPQMNST
ncbi:TetR/AcrR family transcriptional regulator [Ruegeria arenilitoris]|uniref:TetR/AcrR family transcriptional regulator n=1 Tax=Ruegeria arenilitoris TaxID=1173585 RepID=UPI00147E812D|nr:TetR/AcrR family transcriptional regulator [Ruegeria arenilitoris]